MQIDAGDIAKIVAAFFGAGGGFAVIKPFADRLFSFWLERMKERAAIVDAKDRAVERIAVQHERIVGVLEVVDKRLDRIDARLDRIEAHHGITVSPSAVPPEPLPIAPRRQLTDPDLAPTTARRPSTPSTPGAARG